MKILFITNLYPPQYIGGYEIRCKETADELSKRGHHVSVLTGRQVFEDCRVSGNVHRLLFYNPLGDIRKSEAINSFWLQKRYYQLLGILYNQKNYSITLEFLNSTKPDLAFIWNTSSIGIQPVIACQDQGIPVAFSVGDYSLLDIKLHLSDTDSLFKRKYRSIIMGLDNFSRLDTRHILAVSTSQKKIYVENGFPEKNIIVIPRGVRSKIILPAGSLGNTRSYSDNGKATLLFAGRLVPEKAPDVAIKAVDILRKSYDVGEVRLDIVGEGTGDYLSTLRKLVSDLNLEQVVSFKGHVEHSSVIDLYSHYSALLFPSRWTEPLGGTVLEAMARGLIVIASKRGGPLDVIRDGENGLLVPVDDPAKMAEAINRLIQDQNLANMLRRAALKTIYEEYQLEQIVDRMIEYFQHILKGDNSVVVNKV
jgi:glycosyltransferase involved in cell wall biosynthesis